MARVRPLEDLLNRFYSNRTNHSLLKQELQRYLPVRDAKHWAWHLSIPQHIYQSAVDRKESLYPQSDTLRCDYCRTLLTIPMKYPRFHEDTYKAFKSVHYLPSPPQECSCLNLKTLTDHQGNLRVYTEDSNDSSFSLHSGPINLLAGSAESKAPANIHNVFDSPRPHTSDPFSYEVRYEHALNHINLYKVTPHTQHALLPTEDPRKYARAFNIVIYGAEYIYFPTGHALTYSKFPNTFYTPLKELIDSEEHHTPAYLLNQPILTPQTVDSKNAFTNYLYHEVLPDLLEDLHLNLTKKLEKRLKIHRSYAPASPLVPYRLRFQQYDNITGFGNPDTIYRPLSTYRELTILRLPTLKAIYRTQKFDQQDFSHIWTTTDIVLPRTPYRARKAHLKLFKRERIKTLNYLLPRTLATPATILRYALNNLRHTDLPPHTQPNHTLIALSNS